MSTADAEGCAQATSYTKIADRSVLSHPRMRPTIQLGSYTERRLTSLPSLKRRTDIHEIHSAPFTQYEHGISDQATAGPQTPAALARLKYNGIFFNSPCPGRASLDVVSSRPTGNCRYPCFQCLAAWFACRDLPDDAEMQCRLDLVLGMVSL